MEELELFSKYIPQQLRNLLSPLQYITFGRKGMEEFNLEREMLLVLMK